MTRWPDWLSATVVEGDSGGVEAAMEGGGGGAGGGGRRRCFFAIAPCKVARAKNRRPLSTAVLYMHVLARHGSRTYSTTCKRAMRSSVGPWWGSSSPTSVGASARCAQAGPRRGACCATQALRDTGSELPPVARRGCVARLINMNEGGGLHNQGRRRLSTAAPGFAIVRGSLNLKIAHGES